MGRSFVLGLSALVFGLLTSGSAFADHAASAVLRARGTTGSVEEIHSGVREVRAGSIPRAVLRAELDRGIGRFLQNVRVQAALNHGQFVGWKLLALFPSRADVTVRALQIGDVLTKINGTFVERPEAFKTVWDGLRDANELTLDVERDGEALKLRYRIEG